MTTVLPFGSNTIQVYAYEGFNYTISNPDPLSTLLPVSNTNGLNPTSLYFTQNDNDSYTFAVSDLQNSLTASGTPEQFVLSLSSGSNSVNNVFINPGRFLDSNSNSLSNTSYTFFKNEPIPRIRLVAPSFELKPPISVPTLPPGLTFAYVASNIYDISGIPLVTVPNSNYQIIGVQQGGSKVITTRINIAISNERIQLNTSNPIVNGMTIGTPITPRVLTAIPPVGTSVLRYTFPTLPDGIVVTDVSGVVKSSPFFPTDSAYTLILSGTPSSNAAYAFANAGATSNGFAYNVLASRTVPTPLVESTQPFQFAFGETVLFDQTTVPPLYVGVPVDSSSVFFRAQTYFTSNVEISNITALSLPPGLSLNYVGSGRANLTGTPTAVGSASCTIRATNSNGVTREYTTPINVSNDTVSFSSPVGVDLCYSFILSRPVNQAKPEYYPSNIQFVASSSSGRTVTLSAPALSGTGLSLDSNGIIIGIPTTVTPLTDLNVIATVSGSPATATKTVKFSVLNDQFTFANVSSSNFQFIENIAITPFQFPVTTLSGRNIVNFSQTGLPSGLTLNPAGVLSGTPSSSSPTQGNSTIVASTGFASGTRDFSYNIVPDSMLFIVNPTNYTFQAGDPVGNINVDAVAYSGTTISRYDLSINPTYGMTINSNTGVISGTWTNSIPPNSVLPASCNFSVNARAGSLLGVLPAQLTANPIVSNVMLFVAYGSIFENNTTSSNLNSWIYYTTAETPNDFTRISNVYTTGPITDLQIKNNSVSNNVILATVAGSVSQIFRGTHLGNITNVLPSNNFYSLSKVVNKTNTSTWWAAGGRLVSEISSNNLGAVLRSEDDGLTWDLSSIIYISNQSNQYLITRDNESNGLAIYNDLNAPYIAGGIAFKYSPDANVLMAGGLSNSSNPVMLRSSDGSGTIWSNVNGGFTKECAAFSMDVSTMWIATGSDGYRTIDYAGGGSQAPYSGDTITIKYSTDQGLNWSPASNTFDMFGYDIVYANQTWVASGVKVLKPNPSSRYYVPELRFSDNGSNWSAADLSTTIFNPSNLDAVTAPTRISSIQFDGNFWNVFVNTQSPASEANSQLFLFRHDASTSLASNWVAIDISGSLDSGNPVENQNTRLLYLKAPTYLYTDNPPININLGFVTSAGVGPTFTQPIERSFIQYQFIPIQPIQISASNTLSGGQIYFFITTEGLPPGLTFNPITNQITGTPSQAGQVETIVYAKDNNGVSSIKLLFNTLVPRVVRKQDGAGAYTSLLRQYTEVLGAQNARDNRVLPNQERTLGEFMSPEAPDVITQTIDPKCLNPNC